MSFLDHALKGYQPPDRDSVFATYRLLNDTTVEVMYARPEWADAVNASLMDSIFPRYLYKYEALSSGYEQ
jgi:hypothetical protein